MLKKEQKKKNSKDIKEKEFNKWMNKLKNLRKKKNVSERLYKLELKLKPISLIKKQKLKKQKKKSQV